MGKHRVTKKEARFLNLGYNRFLSLSNRMLDKSFWDEGPEKRLMFVKEIILVYSELSKYQPIREHLESYNKPNYELVGKDFMGFLRNLLIHFPLFKAWEDIAFDRDLILSVEGSKGVDRFLNKKHPADVKYRMWNKEEETMTYIEVNLNTPYNKGGKVRLSDIIPEKEGVLFLCLYMHTVLMSQVKRI